MLGNKVFKLSYIRTLNYRRAWLLQRRDRGTSVLETVSSARHRVFPASQLHTESYHCTVDFRVSGCHGDCDLGTQVQFVSGNPTIMQPHITESSLPADIGTVI